MGGQPPGSQHAPLSVTSQQSGGYSALQSTAQSPQWQVSPQPHPLSKPSTWAIAPWYPPSCGATQPVAARTATAKMASERPRGRVGWACLGTLRVQDDDGNVSCSAMRAEVVAFIHRPTGGGNFCPIGKVCPGHRCAAERDDATAGAIQHRPASHRAWFWGSAAATLAVAEIKPALPAG
jgi:hypothetical protein